MALASDELPFEAINGSTPASSSAVSSVAPATAAGELPFEYVRGKEPPQIAPNPINPSGILSNAPDDSLISSGLKSAGTMGVEGVSGALGTVGSLRDLQDELVARTWSWVSGKPLEDTRAALVGAHSQGDWINRAVAAAPSGQDIASKITPYTGAYQPTTELGRLGQAGGSAVIAGALMSPGAAIEGALPNLVGGVAGQGASDLGADPLLATAAGMGAAGATGAVGAKLPAITKGAQQTAAGDILLKSAENPAQFKANIAAPPAENIPNEQATTYQRVGDEGIGQLEREVRAAAPAAFTQRAAQQAESQFTAAKAIQSGGSPEDVANFVTGQARSLDNQWSDQQARDLAAAQTGATSLGGEQAPGVYGQRIANELTPQYQDIQQRAAAQVGALGTVEGPEVAGVALRAPAAAAKSAMRSDRQALYDAIDPDKSLNVVATPLRAAHDEIYGPENWSPDAAQPTGEELAIKNIMQNSPDVKRFADLQALDQRITAARSAELNSPAGESPVWRRLNLQKNAVMNVMNDAVANQVAHERAQVAQGALDPANTVEARLSQWERDYEHEAQRVASGAGNDPNATTLGPASVSGVSGAAGQTIGRFGNNAGSQAIPKGIGERPAGRALGVAAPAAGSRPVGITEFLARNGGLKPSNELKSIFGGENPFVSGAGRVVRNDGMTLDEAHTAARQAGYIHDPGDLGAGPLETSYNDLLEKIAADHGGASQYPIGTDPAAYHEPRQIRQTEGFVRRELSGSGIDVGKMDRRLLDATIDKVASGEHPNPHDALERASIEYEAKLADEAYAHGQKGADYQTPPLTPKLPLVPNMTEATLARQSAAKAKNAEYQETFKQGPVGEMLKPAGYGRFKMSDASVPENVVKQGAKGYETMRAYRKAAGDDPTVLSTIRNYLGYTLRNSALNPDGTINAAKYATWRKNYDGALRGAPELAPQFDSAAHAADSLTKFGKFNPAYAPAHIPDLFFPPGDAGAAGVQQLRSLIGKDKADPMLKDVATSLMRSMAEKNGVIDPAGLEKFNAKYGAGMAQFPDLVKAFADRGKATEQVAKTAAMRREAMDDYQSGVVGKLIGVNDPTTVQRYIGSIFGRADAVPTMRKLALKAAQDPTGMATQGLRQAIADEFARRATSTTKIGGTEQPGYKPAMASRFLNEQKPVLSEIFSPKEMESWASLMKSIDQGNRSISGSKIPGGSNTPQDILKALKNMSERGEHETLFSRLWKTALVSRELLEPTLGAVGFGHMAMPLGLVSAVGSHVLGALRNAGTAKVADMVKDAMLNPDVAKAYVMKASKKANAGSELSLATQLRRLSVFAPHGGVIGQAAQ